ncbi:hypothetical protein GE09DRAFT_1256171 [Coniochaeta sp. 2T2.1]|nr:hypothetical protein GE09DRAFT_1256171 [Coniochaeta sp. 2T2.1]
MKLHLPVLPPILSIPLAIAQNTTTTTGNFVSFTDPGIELTIKLAIPDASSPPFPLLITFSAPLAVGWAGFATGGCMLRSPLIVAWPNGKDVVVSSRWAKAFHPPTPYPNTTLSLLPSGTTVNATHWTAAILCERGCSDWLGGEVDPNYNNGTFGYGASSHAPTAPADKDSAIRFHDLAIGHFDWDLNKAKNEAGVWGGMTKA